MIRTVSVSHREERHSNTYLAASNLESCIPGRTVVSSFQGGLGGTWVDGWTCGGKMAAQNKSSASNAECGLEIAHYCNDSDFSCNNRDGIFARSPGVCKYVKEEVNELLESVVWMRYTCSLWGINS